jgi:hypothetical protein
LEAHYGPILRGFDGERAPAEVHSEIIEFITKPLLDRRLGDQ